MPSMLSRVRTGLNVVVLLAWVFSPPIQAARNIGLPDFQQFHSLPFTAGPDGDLVRLSDGRWLVAGPKGIDLMDGGVSLATVPGRYESLDARPVLTEDGGAADLIAAIESDKGSIVLMVADADALEQIREIPLPEATPEALCLFRNTRTQHVALIMLDARGMLEQRYVYDGINQSHVDIPARVEVGVLDAEACAVDDKSESLFIVDEALGVRRLDAHEETDAVAEPWMLMEPFGPIGGEIEDLVVSDEGDLWVLIPETNEVLRRDSASAVSRIAIPASLEASALALHKRGEETHFAILDEASGEVWISPMVASENSVSTDEPDEPVPATITAQGETAPVRRFGDAADDPAILVDSGSETGPLILGTDKREGLAVYSLDGDLQQFLPVGRVNNVDVVRLDSAGGIDAIAAASNRSNQSVTLFAVKDGQLSRLSDTVTGLDDVYGLCMYRSDSGIYVFINDTSGRYEQYVLSGPMESPSLQRVRQFSLPSQPEGCVADSETRTIYMGEEAAGVWIAGAEPDGHEPALAISVGGVLVADVEGMDIYRSAAQALLVVSSQGSDSFAVFDLNDDYRLVAHFRVSADLATGRDGVSETDGLAVSSATLPGYPQGVLIVQDGRNRMPQAPQNFKLIDWRQVQQLMELRTP